MRKYIILVLAAAAPGLSRASEVLATVNGKSITREDVAARIWARHASDGLNELVDEALAAQAVADFEAKASKKEKEAWSREEGVRLKGLKAQFKDEAAFEDNLKKAGVALEAVRKQIRSQVLREALVVSAKAISVTPAEVKEFFEANKDKLGGQESVRLRHILVASEQQARDLLVAIRVGADFAKLASQLSLDPASRERGGDLGFIARGMLTADIEKVAFSLKPGEVSEVVHTALGFHLFRVEDRREAKPVAFKDVEKDLSQAVLAQKISQAWPAYLKDLRAAAKIVPAEGVTFTPGATQPR